MVLLVYKKSEVNGFVIECSTETKVSTVLMRFLQINNLRVYLDRLIWSVQQLANKGVLKPSDLQGVSWQDFQKHYNEFTHLKKEYLQYGRKPIVQPPNRFIADKHNQRYGVILSSQLQQILLNAVNHGKKVLQFKQEVTNKDQLLQAVQKIREAVMETYPGYLQLPQWEPSVLMLEQKIELQVLETQNYQIFDERATLWWAGKEMGKDKSVGQYIGKNEKTKAIIKVQKWGGQMPLRQPPVDAQTYQKMVKYYYKKVQQTKQSQKHSVQSHYQKVQATNMKAKVHLSQQIRYKPF